MTTTVIVLMDDMVRVAVGRAGKKPQIKQLFSQHVVNATTNVFPWQKALEEIWSEHNLPQNHIRLVLPSDSAILNISTVPDVKKPTIDKLNAELAAKRNDPDFVADHMVFGKNKAGQSLVLSAACNQGEIGKYVQMCDRLGFSLDSITVPTACLMNLQNRLPQFKGQSCIWLAFEAYNVTTIMLDEGFYHFSGRNHVFSEMGTLDFGTEVIRNVSGTLQFWTTTNGDSEPISKLYYSGCSSDNFEVCREGLKALGLEVERLDNQKTISMPEGYELRDWIYCAGAMLE